MDYEEQREFLRSHQNAAAACALIVLVLAAIYFAAWSGPERYVGVAITIAQVYALTYLPKYLYLTTDEDKRYGWLARIRAVAVAAVALVGAITVRTRAVLFLLAAAVAWLLLAALVARWLKKNRPQAMPPVLVLMDGMAAAVGLLAGAGGLTALLLILSSSLSLMVDGGRNRRLAPATLLAGITVAVVQAQRGHLRSAVLLAALLAAVLAASSWLLRQVKQQHQRNLRAALGELQDFTGTTATEGLQLLRGSAAKLAEKWRDTKPPECDATQLAAWYRENSFLYLFDLTAFHLTYKHIAFTLDSLELARGRCLDYGGGTGGLALALARQGNSVTYFDVAGKTREFAEWRASRQELAISFTSSKEELLRRAAGGGFNTIFSLDVLEHLPDLRQELQFLVTLLAPGGRLILTIPSGPTRSHPMHLRHDLDVARCLRSLGMRDAKSLWMRWLGSENMRKDTVLIFEKMAIPEQTMVPTPAQASA